MPHVGIAGRAATALQQLSAPVLDDLVSQIADSSLAVVLADRHARLTRRNAMSAQTRRAMDERSLDIGFSLAEGSVGTNGVGTSLETRQPTVIVGDEHFLETFHGFTCANAPIIHPITSQLQGTVGVMCPATDTSPLLLPTALRLSAQIRELLVEQATPAERFLLDQFLRSRRHARTAVATIGEGVLIATPAAQRRLLGVDHEQLWSHLQTALRQGGQVETDFDAASNDTLRLRCRPIHRDGQLEGAVVEFVRAPRSRPGRVRGRSFESIGTLVGVSAGWRHVAGKSVQAGHTRVPVLVVGERGTGRLAIAKAIAEQRGARSVVVFSSAEVLLEGAQQWLARLQADLASEATVVLQRIDQLPDDVAAAIALMSDRAGAPAIIATTEATLSDAPGRTVLLDRLDVLRIEVPPLRERSDDIPVLARHLAARRGRTQLDARVINTLHRHDWPGNVSELDQVLRSAIAVARTQRIAVEHLPRRIRQGMGRAPLVGLRQQEADAIAAAIESSATRSDSAEQLGISRATLFRRIKAYGLDVPT